MIDFKKVHINDFFKGVLFIIGGIILLLHTLNILQASFNTILVLASVAMILYGMLKLGVFNKILQKKD